MVSQMSSANRTCSSLADATPPLSKYGHTSQSKALKYVARTHPLALNPTMTNVSHPSLLRIAPSSGLAKAFAWRFVTLKDKREA
jgi:hypothetical protein